MQILFTSLPSVGIDEVAGGAVSTKISSSTIKLENMLIAAKSKKRTDKIISK